MLSIAKFAASGDVVGYYVEVVAAGREDYYLSPTEAPGRWVGSAASVLGLEGPVRPEDLRSMLEGVHPRSGEQLVGWRKIPGFDLTLSAPKSVSVMWGLGDKATAAKVVAAHDAAVLAAVAYLGAEACTVRRGREGRVRFPGVGIVAAAFRHRTSRASDPNLHTHLVTGNLTRGPDGVWSALFTAKLYRHARTAGFVYQSVLRHELARRLGVSFDPAVYGMGEVDGVPLGVRRAFSRRRVEIEKAMADHGVRTARGAEIATLDTRPAKPTGVSENELRVGWRRQARELGFAVEAVPRRGRPLTPVVPDAVLGRALTDRDAIFDRRKAIQAVAEGATQGLGYSQILERADAFLTGPDVVAVAPGTWTTPEMLAIESEALRMATRGPRTLPVPRQLVGDAVAARHSLGAEQRRAVAAITTGDRPVAVVVGHAGAGKTFALDAARAAWQAAGLKPVGAALAARAARELQTGSGIPSQTIASLLGDLDTGRARLTPNNVVVVDEAGMVGTRNIHRLLTHTTAAAARLVLVGDPKQLSEIEAGGLFASLARKLDCAELTENRRQRDPAEQATALALRSRRVEEALRQLRRSDRLTVLDNAELVRDRMAEDWYLEHADGKHAVMLALHRSDVADLNRRARSQLFAHGKLGQAVLRVDGVDFATGDRVVALRNYRKIGVLNGTQATVLGRAGNGLLVRTVEGTQIEVPLQYLVNGHVAHAYALTIHKGQGMTCDAALVLGDDTLYAEAGYTAITRGRFRNRVYAVAAPEPDDRLASLRRGLEQSRAKSTALEHTGLTL